MKRLLFFIHVCSAQFNITWDQSLGTLQEFEINTNGYINLIWTSGHNVYYKNGPCQPFSLIQNDFPFPIFQTHPGQGQTIVPLTFANAGIYCVACITHLSTMQFKLTVTQGGGAFVVVQSSPPPSPLNLPSPLPPSSSSSSPPPPFMPSAPPGFTCNNTCNLYTGMCDDGGEGAEYSYCPLGQDCMDCGVRYISPPVYPPLPIGPQPNAPPLPGLPPLPPNSSPSAASPPAASTTTPAAPPPSSPMTDRNHFYWIIPILVIIVIINGVFLFFCIRKCQNDED